MFYGRQNLIRLYMTDYFIFFGVHLSFKVTNFDEKRGLPVLILEIFLFQRHESKFSVPVWLVPSHTNYKTIKKCLWSMKSIKRQRKSEIDCEIVLPVRETDLITTLCLQNFSVSPFVGRCHISALHLQVLCTTHPQNMTVWTFLCEHCWKKTIEKKYSKRFKDFASERRHSAQKKTELRFTSTWQVWQIPRSLDVKLLCNHFCRTNEGRKSFTFYRENAQRRPLTDQIWHVDARKLLWDASSQTSGS